MIKVEKLTKEFKLYKKYEGFRGAIKSLFSTEYTLKRAVDEMDFTIDDGELVGYIGLNGAGKSTTIKMMTGLLVPTAGSCTVNGLVPYENRKEHTKNIGVVFGQRTQLWWDLPVSESFGILQKIYDIPTVRYRENLEYLKDILGLNEFYLTPVRNLSLGQKMRADLAASLIHDPKVIFLDEPTIGLDILVKEKIRKAVKEINKERQTTVILTTHDLDDIEEICSRIIVIDKGRKIYDGTVKDLKSKYGKYKGIGFFVKECKGLDINTALNFSAEEVIKRENDGEVTIQYIKDKVAMTDIVNFMMQNYEVRDMVIQEPKMEEIVKEIYSGETVGQQFSNEFQTKIS